MSHPRISLAGVGAENYIGHALVLHKRMVASGIPPAAPVAIDNCIIRLELHRILIYNEVTMLFACHPRSDASPNGWQGGDPAAPLAGNSPYPLFDSEGGGATLTQDVEGWIVEYNPVGYGNIDWVGYGQEDAPVLTWRGPAMRHQVKAPNFTLAVDGYTHYEETVYVNGLPEDRYTYFSPYIFQDGATRATAPPVSQANDAGGGFGNLALVLGAAEATAQDGTKWLLAMICVNTIGFDYQLYGRTGTSDELYNAETNPGGWRAIGAAMQAAQRPFTCWFFSASGLKAACVLDSVIYRATITLGEIPSCVITSQNQTLIRRSFGVSSGAISEDNTPEEPPGGWSAECNPVARHAPDATACIDLWSGTKDGARDWKDVTVVDQGSWVVAIDFRGDAEVQACINHSASAHSRYECSVNHHYGVVLVDDDLGTWGYDGTTYPDMGYITVHAKFMCGVTWTTSNGTITEYSDTYCTVKVCSPYDTTVHVTAADGNGTWGVDVGISKGGGHWEISAATPLVHYWANNDVYTECPAQYVCPSYTLHPCGAEWPNGSPGPYDAIGQTAPASLDNLAASVQKSTVVYIVLLGCETTVGGDSYYAAEKYTATYICN